jgi:ankyrin repeat protein
VLLDAGAEVDRRSRPPVAVKAGLQDRDEMNALLMAAPIADRNTIELLLKAHANPDVLEYREMNSLISAVTSERQDASIVRLLLRNTADVNVKDKNGLTAMDWARKWGDDTTMVRTLRDAGAAASSEPAAATPGACRG